MITYQILRTPGMMDDETHAWVVKFSFLLGHGNGAAAAVRVSGYNRLSLIPWFTNSRGTSFVSLWPHWPHGFRKAPAFNSQTKPAVKAAELHFAQMMQVGSVFAAELRKGGLAIWARVCLAFLSWIGQLESWTAYLLSRLLCGCSLVAREQG